MIETASNVALAVDIALGIGLVVLAALIVFDWLCGRIADYFGAFPILYQFAVDYHARKKAERKVKARQTVSKYEKVEP